MAPAYQAVPPLPLQHSAPLIATDQSWIDAVRADPSVINQITDPAYKAKIQSLI